MLRNLLLTDICPALDQIETCNQGVVSQQFIGCGTSGCDQLLSNDFIGKNAVACDLKLPYKIRNVA